MPGPRHQFAAQLIRDNPDLPSYLLRVNNIQIPGGRAAVADSNLSPDEHGLDLPAQLHREKRADVITAIAKDTAIRQVIISEPQASGPDDKKRYQWVCYIGAAGFIFGCPVKLLVLALNDRTAAACRATLPTGHPGLALTPIVIHRTNTPNPDAPGGKRFAIQVTMLCVLNGKFDLIDQDTRHYVLGALASAESAVRTSYTRNLLRISDFALRLALEVDYMTTTYGLPCLDEAFSDGETQGREQGHAQGFEKGKIQGASEATRGMLLRILETRGLRPGDETRQRVNSCDDRGQLETWTDNALTATSLAEVFK